MFTPSVLQNNTLNNNPNYLRNFRCLHKITKRWSTELECQWCRVTADNKQSRVPRYMGMMVIFSICQIPHEVIIVSSACRRKCIKWKLTAELPVEAQFVPGCLANTMSHNRLIFVVSPPVRSIQHYEHDTYNYYEGPKVISVFCWGALWLHWRLTRKVVDRKVDCFVRSGVWLLKSFALFPSDARLLPWGGFELVA